ncbi:MAG: alpha/beta fold hydrolase [Verrucomicrobia bacterium]|nr:alpha/beta fold hydrolase [Verrucomicrobiota bacterium]
MFGTIRNTQSEKLEYSFHEGKSGSKRLVVIGHGVTGNKDRPFIAALAEGLAKDGIHALRVSFSGNGGSEGEFRESTISKEVNDLGAVLDALKDYDVCYAGHSMGGAVGVLRAASDVRIRWLISLAGMVHTKDFADREFGAVKPDAGFMWDDPSCPLSQAYMDDMATIGSVVELAPKIQVPWLLVHGSEDDVVPIQDSLDIQKNANSNVELVEIKGASHVFAEGSTVILIEKVVQWVKRLCV